MTQQEKNRYSRQILIPEFGEEGQQKLKAAKVLVIGCGGLGSPILLYLAAAGIGTIGLVENDRVDESNLQRQILYTTQSVGKAKIDEAEKHLKALNPFIVIEKHATRLEASNALAIFENYDLIIDGSDNFPTRYLVNDACVLLNKPYIYGAIYRFEGQVAVFNYKGSSTYRDLFPEPPMPDMAPNCAEAGVLGMMAGIIGSLQANEAIKIIAEIGEPLAGKLLIVEALSMNFRTFKVVKNTLLAPITKLIDYQAFCGLKSENITSITFQEFEKWKNEGKEFQLIDVREKHEYENYNIGGLLAPFSELDIHTPNIRKNIPIVVHCQSGIRSPKAIKYLKEKYGFDNLINLEGGLSAARHETL